MEKKMKLGDFEDPDFFTNIKNAIEKELSDLQIICDHINQLRVEVAYLESDLMMSIDSSTWENISELSGLKMNTGLKDELKDEPLN